MPRIYQPATSERHAMMGIYRIVQFTPPISTEFTLNSFKRMLALGYGRHCYAKNKIDGKLNSAAADAPVSAGIVFGVEIHTQIKHLI